MSFRQRFFSLAESCLLQFNFSVIAWSSELLKKLPLFVTSPQSLVIPIITRCITIWGYWLLWQVITTLPLDSFLWRRTILSLKTMYFYLFLLFDFCIDLAWCLSKQLQFFMLIIPVGTGFLLIFVKFWRLCFYDRCLIQGKCWQ